MSDIPIDMEQLLFWLSKYIQVHSTNYLIMRYLQSASQLFNIAHITNIHIRFPLLLQLYNCIYTVVVHTINNLLEGVLKKMSTMGFQFILRLFVDVTSL